MNEREDEIGVFFDTRAVEQVLAVTEAGEIENNITVVIGKKRDKFDPVRT